MRNRKKSGFTTKSNIHRRIFAVQLILIISLALFLGIAGTLININFETRKRDQNLKNVAETIAQSPMLDESLKKEDTNNDIFTEYLDSLKNTLDDIDVISIVSKENIRLYHSNHELIGTVYDGTLPKFTQSSDKYYAANDSGPSGTQRRAYAAVYDESGNYIGFVMAIMLMENITAETVQILFIFSLITITAILIELLISTELSNSIKKSLHGYEPNVFSAMYQIRDNILESLNEGIVAIDKDGIVQFANEAALKMLDNDMEKTKNVVGNPLSVICDDTFLTYTLKTQKKEFNIQDHKLKNSDVLIDRIPIKENDNTIGAVAILHNRAEYTKLMEDLTGTRYLVDSMRANNHDFTNKLHVILGLIQMEMYDEATSYIENITMVQRATISRIMSMVDEPAVAALLIGKTSRASELNVKFDIKEGSVYSKADMSLSSELLVTVIGNLIDNAFEAMNVGNEKYDIKKELEFGIYSGQGEVLITVDDNGVGISEENLPHIFENGFSTKGEGRGTGLHQVKEFVEACGGEFAVESQKGVGTSFTVKFMSN